MGNYSSGDVAALPGTTADLDHVYDATDLTNVGTDDTNYVNQTGSSGYELHQYKDSITAGNATVTWKGKSSLAPSSSKVQLQVYKVAAPAGWENVSGAGASNNVAGADTDFTLSGTVTTADYLDSGVITFRVYQAANLGNNFSGDTSCQALWRFESAGLTADSKLTNTLTVVGGSGASANTTTFKEGAASIAFTEFSLAIRSDGDLTANFPLKSGDADHQITVACWVNRPSIHSYDPIWSKYNSSTKTGMALLVNGASGVTLRWGDGGSGEDYSTSFVLTAGQWYHIGVIADGVNKTAVIRIWDDTAATAYTYTSPGLTNAMADNNSEWEINTVDSNGAAAAIVDEMVVFNTLKTTTDIDNIRSGTFTS